MKKLLITIIAGFVLILIAFALMIQKKIPDPGSEKGVLPVGTKTEKVSVALPEIPVPNRPAEEKFYFSNGDLSASWIFDPDFDGGELQLFYATGPLWTKMRFKNGQLDGDLIRYYPDGSLWEKREFQNGQENGIGIIHYPGGSVLAQWQVVRGKAVGLPEVFSENSPAPVGFTNVSGNQQSYFKAFTPDSGEVISEWSDMKNKKIAVMKSYFKSGQLSSEWRVIDAAVLDGPSKVYDNTGRVWMDAEYFQNTSTTKTSYYYPDGERKPQIDIFYNADGSRKITKYYYPSGTIWFVLNHDPEVSRYLPKIFSEMKVTVTETKS